MIPSRPLDDSGAAQPGAEAGAAAPAIQAEPPLNFWQRQRREALFGKLWYADDGKLVRAAAGVPGGVKRMMEEHRGEGVSREFLFERMILTERAPMAMRIVEAGGLEFMAVERMNALALRCLGRLCSEPWEGWGLASKLAIKLYEGGANLVANFSGEISIPHMRPPPGAALDPLMLAFQSRDAELVERLVELLVESRSALGPIALASLRQTLDFAARSAGGALGEIRLAACRDPVAKAVARWERSEGLASEPVQAGEISAEGPAPARAISSGPPAPTPMGGDEFLKMILDEVRSLRGQVDLLNARLAAADAPAASVGSPTMGSRFTRWRTGRLEEDKWSAGGPHGGPVNGA